MSDRGSFATGRIDCHLCREVMRYALRTRSIGLCDIDQVELPTERMVVGYCCSLNDVDSVLAMEEIRDEVAPLLCSLVDLVLFPEALPTRLWKIRPLHHDNHGQEQAKDP